MKVWPPRAHCFPINLGLAIGVYIIFLTKLCPSYGMSLISTNLKPEMKGITKGNKLLMGFQHLLKGKEFDPLSPEGSWIHFNRNDALQKKKNRKRKCKKCSKHIPMPKQGPAGPPGPRGPQGPQGMSGGSLSLKDIENYVNVYLADLLLYNKTINTEFLVKKKKSSFVPVVFTAELPKKEIIPTQKAAVIKGFTVTFGPGQFRRGVLVKKGKFTVTRPGVYQVNGIIRIQRKEIPEISDQEEQNPFVYLCVDSCIEDRRLRWSGSIERRLSNSAIINGHVRLRRGQTLMVLLANPTRSNLEVLKGSTFSAALIGT